MFSLTKITVMSLLLAFSALSNAQAYPEKPITLVVGFGPGGNADIVARLVAQKMTEVLGQTVIVENKGGSGGLLANDSVAKSPPDGYRLSLVSGAFTAQAATLSKLPFDPQNDFSWISTIISYPLIVVVPTSSPFKNIDELIQSARKNPKKLNYPSPGNGSLFQIATELFSAEASIEMTHIPFKGGSQQLIELLAGRLDVMFDTLLVVQPSLNSGKLRAIGVTSSARMPQLPEVPTLSERLNGFEASSFLGVASPIGTPPAIIQKLNSAIRYAIADPNVRQRLIELGGTPWVGTPSEMGSYIRTNTEKWKSTVQLRQIKAD